MSRASDYSPAWRRVQSPRCEKGTILSDRTKLLAGLAATVVGLVVLLVASMFVHATEAPVADEFGNELWTFVPRGWVWATLGQLVAVGGLLLAMAGMTLAFVYDRPMTWARAAIGSFLFVALLLILFAVVPNQWLTLAQAELEWTPTKLLVTVPPALVLQNDVSVSLAAFKDMIAGGYAVAVVVVIIIVMVKWQNHQKERASGKPKPVPVSKFGRPMRVEP